MVAGCFNHVAHATRVLDMHVPSGHATLRRIPGGRGYATQHTGSYNGVYGSVVHSHMVGEQHLHPLINEMMQAPAPLPDAGLYMGAAGLINLTFIAAGGHQGAVLFDINPLQARFWNMMFGLLRDCPTRYAFARRFEVIENALLRDIKRAFGDVELSHAAMTQGGILKYPVNGVLRHSLDMRQMHMPDGLPEYAWLRRDDYYAHLRGLAQKGAIGAVTLDLLDDAQWDALADSIGLVADTFYTSNILSFLNRPYDWAGRPTPDNGVMRAVANLAKVAAPTGAEIIDGSRGHLYLWCKPPAPLRFKYLPGYHGTDRPQQRARSTVLGRLRGILQP